MAKPTQPPLAPNPNHPRYCDLAFPAYRFIPGLNPHPVRDPDGHSHGKEEPKITLISPDDWQKNKYFLFGVDLYNHAYWWESHEAWEGLWLLTSKTDLYGQHLQGLIQISAAFIKWHLQQSIGLNKLFDLGINRLEFVKSHASHFMGVDMETHIKKLRAHFKPVLGEEPTTWPDLLQNYPFIELK